ncbi:MAG: CHRD domain-containing protein, partial [Blastocatellia bacterium]
MKRNGGIVFFVVALLAAVYADAQAQALSQTLIATVPISSANEVPPITGLDARGAAVVTINLTRDAATGAIVLGAANFRVDFRFPSGVTVTGLHIHEAAAGANGPVRVDAGLSAAASVRYSAGAGVINLTGSSADGALWQRILSNPAGFYVNLHTTDNPDGALRGQIARLAEALAATAVMTPAQEVPPITGVNAAGLATITVLPTRGGDGTVLAGRGGSVQFTVHFAGLPANSTITGLHIHEAGAGFNGLVRVDTGLSAANPLAAPSGGGSVNITVPDVPAPLLSRLVNTPQFFYVNLHTATFPTGLIRGQLPITLAPAQALNQLSIYSLPTGAAAAPVTMSGSGVDPSSRVVANGFLIPSSYDFQTGELIATLPAALISGPATHYLQLVDTLGRLSPPRAIVVAEPSKLNATAVAVRDAARYGPVVAPDSLGVIFGVNLATATAAATGAIFPTTLAGTQVFIDGVEAQLLFVSPLQINFVVPPRT